MVLLIPLVLGVFLWEGKRVLLTEKGASVREKRVRTVYACIWITGLFLLLIAVLDAKTAVIDAAMECVRMVKLWLAEI